ncbi:MAG: acyl carrier protein [Candidatus Margulisiibacteriota bacterium]
MADLEKEIKSLVAKIVKLPENKIDLDANIFYDLGVDSLLGVEIFAALDKKYHIDIPEDRLKNVKTLHDIIALVREIKKDLRL